MKIYQRKNRACFAGALVSVLISTIFAVSLQFFKGEVLDCAAAGDAENAIRYALLLVAFILCEVGFYFCYKRLSARFAVGCTRLLKRDIFQSILRRGYVSYRERPQGEYIARYTNTADTIRDRRFRMLPLFWEILFKILLVSAALFRLDGRIALLAIALLTTPLYVPKLMEQKLQSAQAGCVKAVEDTLSKINDWLAGFEIIKNYSIEQSILDRFSRENDAAMEKLLRDMQLGAAAQLLTTLISYLSYFLVLACAAWLVLRGEFTAGDFFIAIGMVDQLSYPLISLSSVTRELAAAKPVCAEMERFLAAPAEAAPEAEPRPIARDICFRHVTFAYGGRPPVLRDFSLTLQKGKRYLLKGPSGCGKTTAVNLLLRYYDAQGGGIEVDGVPIGQAGNPYGRVTVVRQEAVLFHDTLRNNLTMYRDIPDDRLIRTLRQLRLEQYANAQALGQTITENGGNLSGGEKKRICLARALLRDTEVLVLDEPLANLDAETAGRIEDLLLSIRGKTVIIVSHQFSEDKLGQFERVVDFSAGA